MFPYYWNSYMYLNFPENDILEKDNQMLPEEVLEALELHMDEIYSVHDKERFLKRQELKK